MTTRHRIEAKNKEQVLLFIRAIPSLYSGSKEDIEDVGLNMRSRLVHKFYKITYDNYKMKRSGVVGNDGIQWKSHSQSTLAYSTPFKGRRGRPLAGKHAPGNKDGMMNKSQLKEWNKIFASTFNGLLGNFSTGESKSMAAGHAWNIMKNKYGDNIAKLHHSKFGLRDRGKYYIGDLTGKLMESYKPGDMPSSTHDPSQYVRSSEMQIANTERMNVSAGSTVEHSSKFNKMRVIVPDEWSPSDTERLSRSIVESLPYAVQVASQIR